MPATDSTITDSLITLKSQYEQALTEAVANASHLREQLSHVNALLLNQLVPMQAPIRSAEPSLTLEEADAQIQSLALVPAATEVPAIIATPKPQANLHKSKAAGEPAPGKRSPRPLLPAYAGVTRLEAIAQLLQATPGQDVTTDQVSEGLFGKLSAADHKAERKSLNTQLYKGQSLKRWHKGTAPGTFAFIAPTASESTPPTPATTATKRKSLPLLPTYAQLTKQEAITQVLAQHPGEVLHHDTIIQSLYGNLSPEDLKAERIRIKTALLTGVRDEKWQKASVPSSYFIKAETTDAKPSGRQSKAQPPNAEPNPAKKRISLTVLPAFEGMTKLDAIATVFEQNPGEVLHLDTIIQLLYGDLSLEDFKAERVRMDTCLRNGVKKNKWKKTPIPASYTLEAKDAGAKPKNPGRKPKEPIPQPEPVAKAQGAKPKQGRKPAVGKAKPSKSKRTEAELVEILQKADIQV